MALVIYGLAVGITVGEEHLSLPRVGLLYLLAYFGGAAAGAVTAWVGILARQRLENPLLGNLVTILTPFTAFLLAEVIGSSGVLAVVVARAHHEPSRSPRGERHHPPAGGGVLVAVDVPVTVVLVALRFAQYRRRSTPVRRSQTAT